MCHLLPTPPEGNHIAHTNLGKEILTGNAEEISAAWISASCEELSAPMGYCGGHTSMLDLARPLESKPSTLLPDNLQLKMLRGGPETSRAALP